MGERPKRAGGRVPLSGVTGRPTPIPSPMPWGTATEWGPTLVLRASALGSPNMGVGAYSPVGMNPWMYMPFPGSAWDAMENEVELEASEGREAVEKECEWPESQWPEIE